MLSVFGTSFVNKLPVYACAGLSLALCIALIWGYRNLGKVQVQGTRIEALEKDLAASEATLETIQAAAVVDAKQSSTRASLTEALTRAYSVFKQGGKGEVPCTATDPQLDRLRALTDAANAGIASASSLP